MDLIQFDDSSEYYPMVLFLDMLLKVFLAIEYVDKIPVLFFTTAY